MNAELSRWIGAATKDLSSEATARIRSEIEAHYADAVESYIAAGKTGSDAHAAAMADLGGVEAANAAYKRIHLSTKEAALVAGLTRPMPWGRVALAIALSTLCLAALALLYHRPAMLWLVLPCVPWLWLADRSRVWLYARFSFRAATVISLAFALSSWAFVVYLIRHTIHGLDLSSRRPFGMLGVAIGFVVFLMLLYGPLWRKVGKERVRT